MFEFEGVVCLIQNASGCRFTALRRSQKVFVQLSFEAIDEANSHAGIEK